MKEDEIEENRKHFVEFKLLFTVQPRRQAYGCLFFYMWKHDVNVNSMVICSVPIELFNIMSIEEV